jgi:hypothetical protein
MYADYSAVPVRYRQHRQHGVAMKCGRAHAPNAPSDTHSARPASNAYLSEGTVLKKYLTPDNLGVDAAGLIKGSFVTVAMPAAAIAAVEQIGPTTPTAKSVRQCAEQQHCER